MNKVYKNESVGVPYNIRLEEEEEEEEEEEDAYGRQL